MVTKRLLSEIFDMLKRIDINPPIGTRSNVERMPNVKSFITKDITQLGGTKVPEIKAIIEEDVRYLPQADDFELMQFKNNLKALEKFFPEQFGPRAPVFDARTGEEIKGIGIETLKKDVNKANEAKMILDEYRDLDVLPISEEDLTLLNTNKASVLDLFEKYLGTKATENLPGTGKKSDAGTYAKQLLEAKDTRGRSPTDYNFDPENIVFPWESPEKFAKGGRVGYAAHTVKKIKLPEVTQARMMSDLDKSLKKGIGSMFKGKI
jgi:hypothetical protein